MMGRRAIQKEKTKTLHIRGPRSDWTTAARTVKRNELDIIGSICGTTRNQVGKVSFETSGVNEKQNHVRDECAERERSSSGSTATATAESDERDSPSNHRL